MKVYHQNRVIDPKENIRNKTSNLKMTIPIILERRHDFYSDGRVIKTTINAEEKITTTEYFSNSEINQENIKTGENQMNNLKKIMTSILDQGLLAHTVPLKQWPDHVKLQTEVLNIFDKVLKTMDPIDIFIADIYELVENNRPWTSYNKFNYKRYFKAADSKFFQLKKKLIKEGIILHLEYNMTFYEMWAYFEVNLNQPSKDDDDLVWMDSELELDGLFYKEILDRIFEEINVYPIVLDHCLRRLDGEVKMKAWSVNWDS